MIGDPIPPKRAQPPSLARLLVEAAAAAEVAASELRTAAAMAPHGPEAARAYGTPLEHLRRAVDLGSAAIGLPPPPVPRSVPAPVVEPEPAPAPPPAKKRGRR